MQYYFKVGSILYLLTNLKKRKKGKKLEGSGTMEGGKEEGMKKECRKENCILRRKIYFLIM